MKKITQKLIYISAGQGPVECTWVAAKVWSAFLKDLRGKGYEYEVSKLEPGPENGTLKAAVCLISTKDSKKLDTFLKDWIGTILWKGKSSFRKLNKRQNWYVGLFELALEGSLDFDVNDVDFQTCKSSGPGGQHVNKRNSAVQAFHKPTGIRVQVSDSRSQIQNRKIAIERIQAKINEAKIDLILQQRSNKWKLNKELERGNPVRTFKGGDFKKVSKVKKYNRNANKNVDWLKEQ